MPKAREELRRGVRHLIETASQEMEALAGQGAEPSGAEADERADRPILRLIRDPANRAAVPQPAAVVPPAHPAAGPIAAPLPPPAPAAPAPKPAAPALPGVPLDVSGVHPRRGVCAAYYVNPACWEVPDAFCNQALHVCMLRECPVYHLHREELERRFAAKFSHLW
ncbi:MAG: hypothetical protein QN168_00300 [Armatimonadota bacterium]|nr:hypothetical protein [Armatimonadota bacterium]